MKLALFILLLSLFTARADGPLTLIWDATPGATYEVMRAPKSAFTVTKTGTNSVTLNLRNSVTNYFFVRTVTPTNESFSQVLPLKTTKPTK